MSVKTTRIREIDILYSIGAILTIFGHSHPNNWASFQGTFFYHCIVFIYTFHMALFFFIAGVLLSNSKSIETKPFIVFIKDKALKLLTPYIVLTLLAIVPKGFLEHRSFDFLDIDFVIKTIFSPRDNIWGHFWFLPVLFICYVVFGFLKKITSKTIPLNQICVLSVCVIVFAFFLLFPPFNTEWLGVKDIFKFALYIPFGMLLSYLNRKERQSRSPVFLPPLCAVLLFATAIVGYIFFYNNAFARFGIQLLMIFSLLSVAFSLRNKGEKLFGFLSKNTFTVYIYSWPFQSFALIVLEKLGFTWRICAPVMFVTGIVCPLVLVTIYNHFKKINCRFFDLVLGIR